MYRISGRESVCHHENIINKLFPQLGACTLLVRTFSSKYSMKICAKTEDRGDHLASLLVCYKGRPSIENTYLKGEV